jgi:glutaconate CoA-transferase subunit B
MSKPAYNPTELLICVAARQMPDSVTAFIGTGIPMLAASLAQKMHAPNLVPIFEFGGTGAQLVKLPRAVGESRTFYRGVAASGICDIMETATRGFVDFGFLGGAQIDPFGNLNSTIIGPQHHPPKVRLPGSGGGNDVGSLCWRTIIIMRHDRRRFVPQVDFVTTPGYLTGPGAREEAGLPPDTGPFRVVSTLALLDFASSKRMRLLSTHPDVTVEQVIENTGFELIIPDKVGKNEPPTSEELDLLRKQIDPEGFYI